MHLAPIVAEAIDDAAIISKSGFRMLTAPDAVVHVCVKARNVGTSSYVIDAEADALAIAVCSIF